MGTLTRNGLINLTYVNSSSLLPSEIICLWTDSFVWSGFFNLLEDIAYGPSTTAGNFYITRCMKFQPS